MLSLPLGGSLVLASVLDFPLLVRNVEDSSALAGILNETGAILATLTAILLAVTALAIQTTLANLPGASFLVGAFARRQGFIPVAALLLGTLVSIVSAVVFADLLAPQTLNDWVVLTTLRALASALLLFDLLRRTLQTRSDRYFGPTANQLTTNWRLHSHEVFRSILVKCTTVRSLPISASTDMSVRRATKRDASNTI